MALLPVPLLTYTTVMYGDQVRRIDRMDHVKHVSADVAAVGFFLERDWDPIGLYQGPTENPVPPGTYQTYAEWIVRHLHEGLGRDAILDDLLRARQALGVDQIRLGDAETADRLLEWWESRAV